MLLPKRVVFHGSVAGSVDAWQSLGDVRLLTLLDPSLLVLQKWVLCLR